MSNKSNFAFAAVALVLFAGFVSATAMNSGNGGIFEGVMRFFSGVVGFIGNILNSSPGPSVIANWNYYSASELAGDSNAVAFGGLVQANQPSQLNGNSQVSGYVAKLHAKGYSSAQVFITNNNRVWYSVYATFNGQSVTSVQQAFSNKNADVKISLSKDEAVSLMNSKDPSAVVLAYASGSIKADPSSAIGDLISN